MDDLPVQVLEGWFSSSGTDLHILTKEGTILSLRGVLSFFEHQEVQVALYHFPPKGIRVEEPGAGTCQFPQGKGCPIHEETPDRLLAFREEGVLLPYPWGLLCRNGVQVRIPFVGMPGHHGRLVVMPTMEAVAKIQASRMHGNVSAGAEVSVQDIESLLKRMHQTMERG
jgi:hypothetical protein